MNPRKQQQRSAPAADQGRQEPASAPARDWGPWLVALGLLAATLIVYHPALQGSLVWDDDFHVTRPELRTWQGLYRIWSDVGATLQYYPLLHTVFWLAHRLWGDAVLYYHLLNVLLHVTAALLFASILRRLQVPGAYLAAAIFALHPIHVESVAWISELKNTLSAVFYLGAALLYLRFDVSRRWALYAGALALFLMAVATKTVTATLPGAILVVLWWQRGRLDARKDVLPLVPLFVLGAAGGLATARWELEFNKCIGPDFEFTFLERILIAGRSIWFHLGKLFWPSNLAFIYPRWQVDTTAWWMYAFPLGVVAMVAGAFAIRRRSRAPLAATLFFCGTLFPVLGFFSLYTYRYSLIANHYQYLASLGIVAAVAAALAHLGRQAGASRRRAVYAVSAALVGVLGGLTWANSREFTDAETLYRTTLKRNPACWLAYNNLGNLLVSRGDIGEAKGAFTEALRLKPDLATALNGMGLALVREGNVEDAIAKYRRAVLIDPGYSEALNNLGVALARVRRFDEAIASYRESIRLDPHYAVAHYNLANALARLERYGEAERSYLAALELSPDMAFARYYLGLVQMSLGKNRQAAEQLDTAFRLKPDFFQGYYEVGNVHLQHGRVGEAIVSYRKAIAVKPDYAEAYCNLATALNQQGKPVEAIQNYREALRLRPDYAIAANNLGRVLEQGGDVDAAVDLYRKALAVDPSYVTAKANLEAALRRQPTSRH